MNRLQFLLLTIVVAGCSDLGAPEMDMTAYEVSPPAQAHAADFPDLQPPSDFGFERDPLRGRLMGDMDGFPEWYCPKSVVTRDQMASFVVRMMHGAQTPLDPYEGGYSDVSESNVHAAAIRRLTDDGILYGCGEGAFCPDSSVTRAQMATIVIRLLHGADHESPPATGTVSDVNSAHLHAPAIEELVAEGLAPMCGANQFCPDRPVTREEMASFLVLARYRGVAQIAPLGTYKDVSTQNEHAMAIEVLRREGVTYGCEAPSIGYRVDGYPLTERQRDWLLYFAGRALPRLKAAYGDEDRANVVASRVIWWSLKEGVFGAFDDPFRHSICETPEGLRYLGAFDTCGLGQKWQVGLNAIEVPNATESEVHAAAAALYPGQTVDEVAIDLVSFGRALSASADAGEYPLNAEDMVLNDGYLMRSWLARDAAIGAYSLIDDIERDCVDGEENYCFSTKELTSRHFAPSKAVALRVQEDILRILVGLKPS